MAYYERDPDSNVATNVIWALVVLIIAGMIFYGLWYGNPFKTAPTKKIDINVSAPAVNR